jgi:oligopeptide/dipeptide ABC transporter ATP-binding protein
LSVQEQTRAVPARTDSAPVLEVSGLTTRIALRRGAANAVDNLSFTLGRGEILGLVGESGCGKTMTALTLMRLLPPAATVTGGTALLDGRDILALGRRQMRSVRGNELAMVFQEPMTSLDPAFTTGDQIVETVKAHSKSSTSAARQRAIETLERVGIANAARRIDDYPHQFSGGMRQRVMLAIALVMRPKVLIADEPTTALDVTIQAQILELISTLRDELGMSVILITHNLGVVNEIADRVAVMYAGEIVESGPTAAILHDPRHPYTQGLLRSMPGMVARGSKLSVIPGRVPELHDLPAACRFAPRCGNRIARCEQEHPPLAPIAPDHELRCFNPTPFVV